MNHVLLNPLASSSQAIKKWQRVASYFSDHQITFIDQQENLIPLLQAGDKVLCAGGDGTIHHFINNFIEKRGIEKLTDVEFGFLGIGSNNSFLQPEKDFSKIGPFFGRWSNHTSLRDLVEVKIETPNGTYTRYMLSNCSLGLLALANEIYNSNPLIQKLKTWNHKFAELYTFLKALGNFKPIAVKLNSEFINFEGALSNLNIMKSSYYTRDLYFPQSIPPDSGFFQGLFLENLSKPALLFRFLRAFIGGKMDGAFSSSWQGNRLRIECAQAIPLEIDGEIYWGHGFEFLCLRQKLRICQ